MSDGKDLRKEAFEMFQQGFKLVDIAKQLNVPAGTVRRWKHSDKWEMNGGTNGAGERSEKANETNAQTNVHEVFKQKRRKRVYSDVQQVEKNAGLTEKQRLFCLFYVRYFNATKAYQKAYGCAYSTAASAGSRLLENAEVRKEIMQLKQGRLNQQLLDESDIFQKYMDIAFSDQ